MKGQRIAAVLLRQYYLLKSSPARLFAMFVWQAVDIVMWGFVSRYIGSTGALPGGNALPNLLGAILLWDFLMRIMHGVVMTFFEDVWSRNFLNIFATPLGIGEYTIGISLSGVLSSQIGLAVMLAIAVGWFGLPVASFGLAAFAFLTVLAMFAVALGILGAALVLRYGPGVEWLVWPIPAILSPFACVFYPVAVLPGWMQAIAHLLPPMYVFEGLRSVLHDGTVDAAALAGSFALALFYIFLAGWTFARVYRLAVRTGLIARYSAESVT